MKTWLKILLGLSFAGIVIVVLFIFYIFHKPHPDFENLKADYTLQAEKLYKSYMANQSTANQLYLGKMIEIDGRLSRIEIADSLVIAVFVFGQGDFGDTGIRCTMLPKFNEEANKLKPDGTVRIKGYCTGFSGSDVIMEQCSINF